MADVGELIKGLIAQGETESNAARVVLEQLAQADEKKFARAIFSAKMMQKNKDLVNAIEQQVRELREKNTTQEQPQTANAAPEQKSETSEPVQEKISEPAPQQHEEKQDRQVSRSDKNRKKEQRPQGRVLFEKQTEKLSAYALLASELDVDLSAVTRENFGDILSQLEKEQVRRDLHEYVFGKVDKCSDAVNDYIAASDIKDKYKAGRWKTVLNLLKDEFGIRRQEDGARVDREKLVGVAIQVYAAAVRKSPEGQTDEAIVKKTQSLLRSVSKVSQRDVMRSLSKKGKDRFLKTLLKMGDLYEVQEFTEKSAQKHVESLLDKLESEQKKMYIETLKKMKFEKFIPQPEKQGEEKMAEDNQNIETTTEKVDAPASEEQTPAYEPSDTLKKMARIADVGLNGIENDEALIAIIESKGYKVNGDQLLRIDGSNETEVDIDAEIKKLDDEAEKKANPLEFSAMEGDTPAPTPTENEDNKWIAEKIAYYKGLSEANKINNYEQDETITDGFAASFNDAKIHYTTKTNVAVSKDALYSVYDVMLKDPHNVGRPVNFSDNMTPEMAARLYAACIVNGNEMGGAVPQLTDEMKQQLKEEMGDEAYAVFEAKLAARAQNAPEQAPQQPTEEENNEPTLECLKDKNIEISRDKNSSTQIDLVAKDNDGNITFEFHGELNNFYELTGVYRSKDGEKFFDNKGEGNSALPEADKRYIDEQIQEFMSREAMLDQYKMSQMEASKKIIKGTTGSGSSAAEVFLKGAECSEEEHKEYMAMRARAVYGKSFLVEEFKKDPSAFRAKINEVVTEERQLSKIDQLRLKRLKGEETKDEVNARREENKNIIKASLGIIDSYTDSNGVEHKKLESDNELIAYIKRQKISEYSYHNLGGEDDHVKALVADHGFNVKNTGHENVNS